MGRVAFSTQIEGFDRRVRALLEAFSAPDIERSSVLDAVVEELSTSLEELKVAEEELAAQNLELESAHASLEVERRRYRDFFMSAQEGYLVTDSKGTIVEGNVAAARLLGSSITNLAGKPLSMFVVPQERADFQKWLRRIRARDLGVSTHEEANVNTLGRDRSFRCSFTFWRTDGEDVTGPRLRWALQDLSDRDRARERDWFEEQAVRKDEFLAVLAHELRNPLAAITLASAQLTRRVGPADERMARAAETVKSHTIQLTRLVDDLIDVSRVYHGKIALDLKVVELTELVANAVSTVQPLLRRKRHLLSVDRDPEPLWLKADPLRLQQVLVNLLDNAAKYTPEGERIEVRMRRSGGRAVVTVRDFGIGIPPDLIDHIFGLFEQGTGSASGLGIGLTLVRELVKMHGGTVEAYSAGIDQGSEFVVSLPLVHAPAEIDEGPQLATAAEIPAGASARVLIVDDSQDSADLVGMALEELGHTVRIAYTAEKAQELVSGCTVALVDLAMPAMDGFELAPLLRRIEPGLALIAVTGFNDSRHRSAAEQLRFKHYLVKPVDLGQLDGLLRAVAVEASRKRAASP
jgi:PAS domain S-box-containing protein